METFLGLDSLTWTAVQAIGSVVGLVGLFAYVALTYKLLRETQTANRSNSAPVLFLELLDVQSVAETRLAILRVRNIGAGPAVSAEFWVGYDYPDTKQFAKGFMKTKTNARTYPLGIMPPDLNGIRGTELTRELHPIGSVVFVLQSRDVFGRTHQIRLKVKDGIAEPTFSTILEARRR